MVSLQPIKTKTIKVDEKTMIIQTGYKYLIEILVFKS
jgi:hypothetical protein